MLCTKLQNKINDLSAYPEKNKGVVDALRTELEKEKEKESEFVEFNNNSVLNELVKLYNDYGNKSQLINDYLDHINSALSHLSTNGFTHICSNHNLLLCS